MKVVQIFKALSDPNRLRALYALRENELCVCQIIELLGLAPSTVSKHMSVLAQAGLVNSTKKGRWVYFRALEQDQTDAGQMMALLPELTETEGQIDKDRQALKKILELDPETLCRLQSEKNAK